MIKRAVRASSDGHKASSTLANGSTERSMEWACGSHQMAIATWANGNMGLWKAKASINARMAKIMKAASRTFSSMAGANSIFPIEIVMRALMLRAFHMVKGNTPGIMEQRMKVILLRE
jgi:hypothetical protein